MSEWLHKGNAVSALILALVLSMTDSSAATSAAAAAPHASAARDPNKVVCREDENAGSHIATPVCKTRAQWDEDDRRLERFMRDVRHNSAQNTGVPAGMTAPGSAP